MSTGDDPLRVAVWAEYEGQHSLKARLRVHIDSAIRRGTALDNILLEAAPGLGKTSVAQIIATEMGMECRVVTWPLKPKALFGLIRRWEGGVLVFDEIHRGSSSQKEELLTLVESGYVQTDSGRKIYADGGTTIVGCTTEWEKVNPALRDRFPIKPPFTEYTDEEMGRIITGMGRKVHVGFNADQATFLGGACAGTPRQARDLVIMARDLQTTDPTRILSMCQIDQDGLTTNHITYLRALDQCGGFRVGLSTIMSITRFTEPMIRDLERLLMRRDLVVLESTGRELTNKGFAKVNPKNKTGAPA